MSKRTIRMVDLVCDAFNWNNRLATVQGELAKHGPRAEVQDEIKRWTAERDRAVAQLRETVAALTPDEISLIQRRYEPDRLAGQLREVGIEPPWRAA